MLQKFMVLFIPPIILCSLLFYKTDKTVEKYRETTESYLEVVQELHEEQKAEVEEAFAKGYTVYIDNVKQDREEMLLTSDILNSYALAEVNDEECYISFRTKTKNTTRHVSTSSFLPLFIPVK